MHFFGLLYVRNLKRMFFLCFLSSLIVVSYFLFVCFFQFQLISPPLQTFPMQSYCSHFPNALLQPPVAKRFCHRKINCPVSNPLYLTNRVCLNLVVTASWKKILTQRGTKLNPCSDIVWLREASGLQPSVAIGTNV